MDSLEEQREALYTPEERVRAWSETADVVKTYSDEMVTRWKEEIDTLLVFVRGCCRMEDVYLTDGPSRRAFSRRF